MLRSEGHCQVISRLWKIRQHYRGKTIPRNGTQLRYVLSRGSRVALV